MDTPGVYSSAAMPDRLVIPLGSVRIWEFRSQIAPTACGGSGAADRPDSQHVRTRAGADQLLHAVGPAPRAQHRLGDQGGGEGVIERRRLGHQTLQNPLPTREFAWRIP
jgi:hypothetical protein